MTAFEKFRNLKNGVDNSFLYNGVCFYVDYSGFTWKIKHSLTDLSATCHFYVSSLTDLQGVAVNLIDSNKNLIFDRNGNIV